MWHFVVILLCKQYFPSVNDEEKWGKAHETRERTRTNTSVKERENVVNPFGMFSVLKKDLQSEGEKCDTCERSVCSAAKGDLSYVDKKTLSCCLWDFNILNNIHFVSYFSLTYLC